MALLDAEQFKRFYVFEVPTGTVNGSNTNFSLSQAPLEDAAVIVMLDGLIQDLITEYSISGTTITFVTAPAVGQKVLVQYVQKKGGS